MMGTMDGLIVWLREQPLAPLERELLEALVPIVDGSQSSWAWFEGSEAESETLIRDLAARFSDHDGYRAEWRAAP
jgi:hypothetical protein